MVVGVLRGFGLEGIVAEGEGVVMRKVSHRSK